MRSFSRLGAGVLAITCLAATLAQAATDIRNGPGGKRLLFVDGNDLRTEPGGKRLLFIDGDAIRPEPGGKRLLFIDGSSIRTEPGGDRLLFLDGNDIRHEPGGDRLLFLDGDSIRPEPGGNRLYFIDGAALTRAQLVAVLYVLQPELFGAEKAAEEKPAEKPNPDSVNLTGEWRIDAGLDLDGEASPGTVTLKKADGPVYTGTVTFKGQPPAHALAVTDGKELWLAIGAGTPPGIGMYDFAGGDVNGKWLVDTGDGLIGGTEVWKGPAALEGKFELVESNAGDVVTKGGAITLKPIDDESGFGAPLVHVDWALESGKYIGVAFRAGDDGPLVICFGDPAQKLAIVRLEIDGDSMSGGIVTEKGKNGMFSLMK